MTAFSLCVVFGSWADMLTQLGGERESQNARQRREHLVQRSG
jgi:hypothetical protein